MSVPGAVAGEHADDRLKLLREAIDAVDDAPDQAFERTRAACA